MASSQTGNVVSTVAVEDKSPTSMSPIKNRRLRLVFDELDEIGAYRRIDEFFAKEGELFELMEVLGIHDEEVLEQFLSLGFTPRTAPAIEMIPVAFVAWASGEVSDGESTAAVSAIFDSQLTEFPRTLSVVQTWLDNRPKQDLWELWTRYMHCRLESMPIEQRMRVHQRLMSQVRQVARASGGWLGIGSICHEEQLIIDEIDSVFRDHFPEVACLFSFAHRQE